MDIDLLHRIADHEQLPYTTAEPNEIAGITGLWRSRMVYATQQHPGTATVYGISFLGMAAVEDHEANAEPAFH